MTVAQILTSHLGLMALVGTLYLCHLLQTFSRRLGAVTKMPAYHNWFHVGNSLIAVAALSYITQSSVAMTGAPVLVLTTTFAIWTFHLPLALGVGINLATTLIYWGWLMKEH
ncbi:MAG: hypothetical protein U9R05_05220 [Chloroflexota bacterium]|nr:hypothetical protein [Chloroflexota bacterium]